MIRVYPDPVLRRPARPVKPQSAEARAVAEALRDAFSRVEGLGLASNQIGFLSRVIIVKLKKDKTPVVMLNPRILWRSPDIVLEEEGCLSLPGVWAIVPRAKAVRAEYQDEEGQKYVLEVEDLEARLIQHEIDHLDGVLFIDHLPAAERQRALRVFQEIQARKKEVRPSAVQVRA